MTLGGVDVSHWQSVTPGLSGVSFLIARASVGTQTDERYDQHIANARRAGIVTGAYHFSDSGSSPAAQVRTFLDKAGDVGLFALDVEGARHMSEGDGREFIRRVQATGRRIAMYHSDSGFPYWGQDWNWVASYSYRPTRHMEMWQYGPYHGVDGDTFFGSLDDLRALAGATPVQLPITTQVPKLVTTGPNSTWYDLDGSVLSTGHSALTARLSPYGCGTKRAIFGASGIVLVTPKTIADLPAGPVDPACQAALSDALATIAGEPGRLQAAIEQDRINARVGVIYP